MTSANDTNDHLHQDIDKDIPMNIQNNIQNNINLAAGEEKKAKTFKNPIRSLYDWVLGLAEKPSAQWALFLIAFAESSFFPVPPDVLLLPMVLGDRKKWLRFAVIVTVGSVLGGVFGYMVGNFLWLDGSVSLAADAQPVYSDFANFCFNNIPGLTIELFNKVRVQYNLYGFWIVFTAGFSPIPYKIFTISSGAFGLNFFTFFLASVISRGARFFLEAVLLFKFGEPIKKIIDKYFNWLALLFTILLIGGFVLVKKVL